MESTAAEATQDDPTYSRRPVSFIREPRGNHLSMTSGAWAELLWRQALRALPSTQADLRACIALRKDRTATGVAGTQLRVLWWTRWRPSTAREGKFFSTSISRSAPSVLRIRFLRAGPAAAGVGDGRPRRHSVDWASHSNPRPRAYIMVHQIRQVATALRPTQSLLRRIQ